MYLGEVIKMSFNDYDWMMPDRLDTDNGVWSLKDYVRLYCPKIGFVFVHIGDGAKDFSPKDVAWTKKAIEESSNAMWASYTNNLDVLTAAREYVEWRKSEEDTRCEEEIYLEATLIFKKLKNGVKGL